MGKTIVHVYTNDCVNWKYNSSDAGSYWGLGDIIRGTIKLYQLSEILGFQLYVDFQLHPIAPFLEPVDHPYKENVIKFRDKIPYYYIDKLEDFVIDFMNHPSLKLTFLNTNDKIFSQTPISDGCKKYLRSILKPTKELEYAIQQELNKLDKPFTVFHIRTGDNSILPNGKLKCSGKMEFIAKYDKYINLIISKKVASDILITDNEEFKNGIRMYYADYIKTNNLKICHLGLPDLKTAEICDTLTEFFVISRAAKIKTYTVYPWISGYVERINQIYNVPLEANKI